MFKLKTKHFLTGEELSNEELESLLDLATLLKKEKLQPTLSKKNVGLIFEKPSLRTRVSFTVGINDLGGNALEINSSVRKKETPEQTIKVLQGYLDGVMVRTFEHEILEEMVQHSKIPVINGLSDLHHPCQVLADLQTLKEHFGKLKGLKLAYIGDGNNMLHSLMFLLPRMGVDVHYACPKAYQPDEKILQYVKSRKQKDSSLGEVKFFETPAEAVKDVNAIYTDVWASMGFEKSKEEEAAHLKQFEGYQVNQNLLNKANSNAVIMHCMPVNLGQEITEDMMNHPSSVLYKQSENRLHAQKALMMGLFS